MAAPTLRSWERRYGVPSPARSSSSYRLYDEADIELVRQMRDLIAEGVAPAEAAARIRGSGAQLPAAVRTAEDRSDAVMQERLVRAVQALDLEALGDELQRATLLGPAVEVGRRLLMPALRRVGELWEQGELTTAHEHLLSEQLQGTVHTLLRLTQPSAPRGRLLLACSRDEQHVFPLYGAAFELMDWGYGVVVLGARTPPEALAVAVQQLRPDLVGLSVTTPPEPGDIEALMAAYARAMDGVPWMVGGAAARQIEAAIERSGGYVVREPLSALRERVNDLVAEVRRPAQPREQS